MNRSNEQQLVDLCFSIALMLSTKGVGRDGKKYDMTKLSIDEKALWIAKQLRDAGFDTRPVGSSHGILVK